MGINTWEHPLTLSYLPSAFEEGSGDPKKVLSGKLNSAKKVQIV